MVNKTVLYCIYMSNIFLFNTSCLKLQYVVLVKCLDNALLYVYSCPPGDYIQFLLPTFNKRVLCFTFDISYYLGYIFLLLLTIYEFLLHDFYMIQCNQILQIIQFTRLIGLY